MEKIYSEILEETLFINRLSSGVVCYIIPKARYVEKQAMLTVKYGAADRSPLPINGAIVDLPSGIAHFLEHKLFEDTEKSLFDQFSALGANVNAFTTFNQTSYYFNCIDNFEENLKLLTRFCQNPYFTDENVEKEKGIIAQEINMYDDTPQWRVYQNLNVAMYGKEHPLAESIAGSVDSIYGITKDMLYACYNTYYTPANMALICVGELDPYYVSELAERYLIPRESYIPQISFSESYGIHERYISHKMPLATSIFELGFVERERNDPGFLMAIGKILPDIIAGDSSELHAFMFHETLIDSTFGIDYISGSFYGQSIFAGYSRSPRAVSNLIINEIERLRKDGINPRRFESIRRKHLGRLVRASNYLDQICNSQAELFTRNMNFVQYVNAFQNLTLADAQRRLNEHFIDPALSVIEPI
ncbi:MAG: insulinase family protein [Clostridiales bacterium]|jgi:predicted Zn-dependent peptidase|nr:insulinase family protein [Clostridiales bacterium]